MYYQIERKKEENLNGKNNTKNINPKIYILRGFKVENYK